jgi:hypothetical protein
VGPLCKTVELEKAAISLRRRGCLEHLVRGRVRLRNLRQPDERRLVATLIPLGPHRFTWNDYVRSDAAYVERLRPDGRGFTWNSYGAQKSVAMCAAAIRFSSAEGCWAVLSSAKRTVCQAVNSIPLEP